MLCFVPCHFSSNMVHIQIFIRPSIRFHCNHVLQEFSMKWITTTLSIKQGGSAGNCWLRRLLGGQKWKFKSSGLEVYVPCIWLSPQLFKFTTSSAILIEKAVMMSHQQPSPAQLSDYQSGQQPPSNLSRCGFKPIQIQSTLGGRKCKRKCLCTLSMILHLFLAEGPGSVCSWICA